VFKLSIESSHIIHNHNIANHVHHSIKAPGPCTSTVEQEKTRLLLEEKNKKNAYLKEMIEWLKQKV